MKPKLFRSLQDARRALLSQVKKWATSHEKSTKENAQIVRFEAAVENAHPLEWLTLQDCSHKIFWENRSQREQFAGIGAALEVKDGRDGYEKILLTVSKLLQNSPKAVRFFWRHAF